MKPGDKVRWVSDYPKQEHTYVDDKAVYEVQKYDESWGLVYLNVPGDKTPDNPWDAWCWELVPKEYFIKEFIKKLK